MDGAPGSVTYPLQLASVSENHAALYAESLKNPEQFWGDLARRRLRWIKEFDQVMDCDMQEGRFKWFIGGTINVSGEQYKSSVVYMCKMKICGACYRTPTQIIAIL